MHGGGKGRGIPMKRLLPLEVMLALVMLIVPLQQYPAHAAGAREVTVNFDDISAPCFFDETHAVRFFGSLGFVGGGAILNKCGDFGVAGYSRPNFLAFNCDAQDKNNNGCGLPETIIFPKGAVNVSLTLGSAYDAGQSIVVSAVHGRGNPRRQTIALSGKLKPVTFHGAISRVTIASSSVCVLVVDSIQFRQVGAHP
jgi:hypothetical protein